MTGAELTIRLVDDRTGEQRQLPLGSEFVADEGICHTCNTAWMASLERKVRPFLLPMMSGDSVRLDRQKMKLLARWCVKTAVTLEMYEAGHGQTPTIPEQHRRYVHRMGMAPPNVTVSVATYNPVQAHGMIQHRQARIGPDPTLPIRSRRWAIPCYAATILLGHLMFQVVGPLDPSMSDWGVICLFPFRSVQIWPSWRPPGGSDPTTHPAPPGHFPPELPPQTLVWPTPSPAHTF
jgi:hypothetical protein